jgi:predicted alpha/beta hydrolase family esterase
MLNAIDKEILIDKNTCIIGHSIGTLLAMRIAEKVRYEKMILVAGWDFNDLTTEHRLFWKSPINHQTIRENTNSRYCFTSENDPYFTKFSTQEMAKRLDAKVVVIPDAGHFTSKFGVNKLPELVDLFT